MQDDQILSLPFIPPPYDDEIIGSWLGRIELLNNRGAWRSMLERIGYGKKMEGKIYDLFDYDEKIEKILGAIGTDYNNVILNLTSLGFWNTFNPKTRLSPSDTNSSAPPTSRVKLRHLRNGTRFQTSRWHCPGCITEDVENEGMPYWRRTHNLPTSIYCLRHRVPLENSCSSCKRTTIPYKKGTLGTLTLHCECGTDRRNTWRGPQNIPKNLLRLAEIGIDALNLRNVAWSTKELSEASKFFLKDSDSKESNFYVLASKMNGYCANREQLQINIPKEFRQYKFNSQNKPFYFAAAFSTQNAPLQNAMEEYFHHKNQVNRHYCKIDDHSHIDISSAQTEILTYIKKKKGIRKLRSFWYMRIYHPNWLTENGIKFQSLSTIAEDRICIRRSNKFGMSNVRAMLRDTEWYKKYKFKKTINRSRKILGGRLDQKILNQRNKDVQRALEQILRDEDKPARITYGMLGHRAGLTEKQVMNIVLAMPELVMALKEANDGKIFRQMKWGLKKAIDENKGGRLLFSDLPRYTLLSLNPTRSKYLRECIDELGLSQSIGYAKSLV